MSRKILVADDSDNIRNVLQLNFEWKGYEVLSAADGEEALRLAERVRPDLIILDIMMPRKNGFQVCRQFKSDERTADIPVILLTAKNQQEDRFWGKDCGADEYITKPFNTPALEEAVLRLLDAERPGPGAAAELAREGIEAAIDDAVREGHACGVAVLRLEPQALMVHRQKYGELRHRLIFEAAAGAIAAVLEEEHQAAAFQEDDDGFRVLIQASAERVRSIQNRIIERANESLTPCYDDDDRERGHVVSRDPRTGATVQIPLATLEVEKTQFYNQD